MGEAQVPARVHPFGPFAYLGLRAHELTVKGRNTEALRLTDEYERIVSLLGDDAAVSMLTQVRMYALIGLRRFEEALRTGEALLRRHQAIAVRCSEAKTLADIAEVLVRLGRLDEGLHRLARATALLETTPPTNPRYASALASVSEAARAAELFELADEYARAAVESFDADPGQRAAMELQRAELLLDWALRLEQIGLVDEAGVRYAAAAAMARHWVDWYRKRGPDEDAPLAAALLALGLAKIGRVTEALALCESTVGPLRAAGREHEARLVHLAYGTALRAHGDLRAARREFIAAEELSAAEGNGSDQLIFQYELAALAAMEFPGGGAQAMLAALRDHALHLWRLRMERRTLLNQARQRVRLEDEHARADTAAGQDALTGLGNRRSYDRQLAAIEAERPDRVVLLLVDLDRFKLINDRYSHGMGDRVLREVGAVLRAHCRPHDVPIRFGGDEFAVFLRADLESAARVGDRIRQVIAGRDWDEFAPGLRVTVSVGAAAYAPGMSGHDLFDAADRQLYAAKSAGRNRLAL
ncbi:diguanylate cyclase (GGDEF) domain-containing protein [Micromonospora pattaloongensis]|uniref:Diguanylate cyclase (GGDEF) domain-containing protein n=1 Tax=Micromonospora pattaloongensis TaxID=405436 RepID=A0A1H3JEF5_9ACTN|nr:GGDEF domain-containing protein [Micromonospora pattaloongensis]SDY38316.1 diguanylate cyclase (GGDEF) domain-containing protein [Micromonospora pattaloongensis]